MQSRPQSSAFSVVFSKYQQVCSLHIPSFISFLFHDQSVVLTYKLQLLILQTGRMLQKVINFGITCRVLVCVYICFGFLEKPSGSFKKDSSPQNSELQLLHMEAIQRKSPLIKLQNQERRLCWGRWPGAPDTLSMSVLPRTTLPACFVGIDC